MSINLRDVLVSNPMLRFSDSKKTSINLKNPENRHLMPLLQSIETMGIKQISSNNNHNNNNNKPQGSKKMNSVSQKKSTNLISSSNCTVTSLKNQKQKGPSKSICIKEDAKLVMKFLWLGSGRVVEIGIKLSFKSTMYRDGGRPVTGNQF